MKILSKLFLTLACGMLIACPSPLQDKNAPINENAEFEKKINAMLGEWDSIGSYEQHINITKEKIIYKAYEKITYIPIKIGDIPYPEEIEDYRYINRTKYLLSKYDSNEVALSRDGKYINWVLILDGDTLISDESFSDSNVWKYKFKRKESNSSSNSGNTGETVTLFGEYNITNSNQSGAKISMSNGNWTYNYYGNIKTGTYSQNGNELTINYYYAGYNQNAIFTVSKTEDGIILTDKSGDTDAIKGLVFMTSELNVKLSAN